MHLCHLYRFTHEIFITFLPAPLSYMVFLLSGGPPAAGTAPLILQFGTSQRHAQRSLSGLQTPNEPVGLDWLSPCSFFFFFPSDQTVLAELHRQGTESTFTAHIYSKGETPLLLA